MKLLTTVVLTVLLTIVALAQPAATLAVVPVTLCQLTDNAYLYKDRPVQLKATLLTIYFGEVLIGLMLTDNKCEPVEAFFDPERDATAILQQMDAQGVRELEVTVTGKLRDVEGKAKYGPFAMLHYQLVITSVTAPTSPLTLRQSDQVPQVSAYQRGVEQYEKGDLRGALESFEQAIKTLQQTMQAAANRPTTNVETTPDPGSDPATVYYWRGLVRYDLREWNLALSDFDQALRYNPRHLQAIIKRGNACLNKGDHEDAVRTFSKAITLDPKMPLAWNNRGLAWLHLAELDAAASDFDKALELNPRLVSAWNNRAGVKHDRNDFAGALSDYDEAIRIAPELALLYNNRGVTHKALDDLPGALRDYNRAIELRPGFRQAYLNRSRVLLKLNRVKEAAADMERSAQLEDEPEPLLEPPPLVNKPKPPIQ